MFAKNDVAGITATISSTISIYRGKMYIEQFWIKDKSENTLFELNFCNKNQRIKRWSIFDNGKKWPRVERTLFAQLLAVCLGGSRYIPTLEKESHEFYSRKYGIAKFGAILRSDSNPKTKDDFYRAKTEYAISLEGPPVTLVGEQKFRWRGCYARFNGFNDLRKPLGDFAYAFSASKSARVYDDNDPDFTPRLRSARFGTLFDEKFVLTDPIAWLYKQHQAAIRNSKKAANLYNTAITAFNSLLFDVKFSSCDQNDIHFVRPQSNSFHENKQHAQGIVLSDLPAKQIRLIEFFVDFIRCLNDSQTGLNDFNLYQGILFVDHLECLVSYGRLKEALQTFERLFPNIQFIVGCTTGSRIGQTVAGKKGTLPENSSVNRIRSFITTKRTTDNKTWEYRNNFLKSRFDRSATAGEDDVVLVDIDSSIPNLSLMKLSRYYKNQGRNVILTRMSRIHCKSNLIFASCVFNRATNTNKLKKLKELYGENIQIGGTGFDITKKLPDEIECLMPDYSLYRTVDFGLGFLTRGCPKKCAFCIVPDKEGRIRQVAEIDDILPGGWKKLVLMDNNLLALSTADKILKEIAKRQLQVNFNQTLDIRLINKSNARLLEKLNSKNYSFTKRMYYFSFNHPELIPIVEKKLKLFDSLKSTEIRFICMYGYNTTLSEDIERFSFLHKLGISPFVQKYQPPLGHQQPESNDYFDADIRDLLSVHFAQNGRFFENFLKWVSRQYVIQFGRLYMPLVDLIFKYNNKQNKHRYIASLAGTKKLDLKAH